MENILLKKRTAAGMTQRQIAQKAGITDTGYLNYEHGKREPKVSTAIKIAKALNTTVEDLWNYKNPN